MQKFKGFFLVSEVPNLKQFMKFLNKTVYEVSNLNQDHNLSRRSLLMANDSKSTFFGPFLLFSFVHCL